MDLPPGQSYVFQRECMTTYNYQVKSEHQDKCNDIDEVVAKRKDVSGSEEVMFVKVDAKCFDAADAAHTNHNHNHQPMLKQHEHEALIKGPTLLLAPQELSPDVCKKPESQSPQPIGQSPPMPAMEPSQSTSLVKSVERKDQLWCQKIDTEDIAHFLDVDIDMKDTDLKYSTPLGTLDSKVLSCLRHKSLPGCKENNYNASASERKLYTQHQYVQTVSEKPFTCVVCGKYFNQASHLQQHTRTHTGERPFTCTLCSGTFTRPSDLKRHMRTHTGEKPYKCSVCSNMFGDVSHLKSHMRTHTGEKPYSCPICSKAFARHSSLKRHMRVHNRDS